MMLASLEEKVLVHLGRSDLSRIDWDQFVFLFPIVGLRYLNEFEGSDFFYFRHGKLRENV